MRHVFIMRIAWVAGVSHWHRGGALCVCVPSYPHSAMLSLDNLLKSLWGHLSDTTGPLLSLLTLCCPESLLDLVKPDPICLKSPGMTSEAKT